MKDRLERARLFVRDIEPEPGYETVAFDPSEEVAIEPSAWEEFVPVSEFEEMAQIGLDVAAGLRAENKRLREGFVDLLEEAKDMRSYVPDYFAKKWKHDEALERAKSALTSDEDLASEEGNHG